MSTLAIDQGTSSTRALRVDEEGRVQVLASLAHGQTHPAPGRVEHDGEELLRNLRLCLEAAGGEPGLAAVGLDNQGESCLVWDARSGEPLGPVIVWQDDRTAAVTERLKAQGAEAEVRERAGLPLDPYFSASKLAWMLNEYPQARWLAERGLLRLGTTDAFFLDRLTGRYVTDRATASRTSLMNIATGQWDAELCRLFGVPIDLLPEIVPCTGEFGALECGGRSVPLTASIVDQQAALYGHGCRAPGQAKVTFGTGAFALQVTGALCRPRQDGPLPTVAWHKAGEAPVYALEGGVYCASSALDWARGLRLFESFEQIESFAAAPAIERGLTFVPALAGLACPHWDRAARGSWLGLALDTGRTDLVQALLEGVALRTVEVLEAMDGTAAPAGPVSIDGGMTANGYFCQFLADTLGRPLLVSAQPELTALGAAALAAEAVGRPFPFEPRGHRLTPRPVAGDRRAVFAAARAAAQAFGARAGGG